MPPYNSQDLPSAGRRPVLLSSDNEEATAMKAQTESIHSEDHLDTEGLRTRSPSPEAYDATQRTFSNSATTSDSPAQLNSCSSSDDVFYDDPKISAMPVSVYENMSASQSEQPIRDLRALVGGSQSVDPQDVFSPTACVFVANLARGCEDATLRAAVSQLFSRYGTVYIKIKRDVKGMPFAFCQYETTVDAERALKEGNGRYILGRKCRAERCKGNVSFIVYRKFGRKILIKEAHDLLIVFGPISSVCTLEENCRKYLQIPHAMVVTFDMFDQRRDVVRAFQQNPTYCVQAYDHGEVSRMASLERGSTAMIHQYRKDRRSIYLGHLPRMYTEDLVRVTVSPFGTVNDIQMKQNFLPDGSTSLYAFVEFDDEDSTDKALEFFNSRAVEYNIRAEKKKLKLPSATHSEPSGPARWGPSTNSNADRYVPAPAVDPFSLPPTAPASQASSFQTGAQAPTGPATSRWGGHISDTASDSSQSMVQWHPRRQQNPSQAFDNTQRPQRRGAFTHQPHPGMGRGQARGVRNFTQPGAQQAIAQTGFGHPNAQGNVQQSRNQFYVGPVPNPQPAQAINQHLSQHINTAHEYGRGVGSLPSSLQPNVQPAANLPAVSQMGQVDVLQQLDELSVNQGNIPSSVVESSAEPNTNPKVSSTAAQPGSESASSGDAAFTATGSDTESEAQGSPRPVASRAPLMPAVNRVRRAGFTRSYSDVAERAANRAEKAIEQNDAAERRAISMKVKSEENQADHSRVILDVANVNYDGRAGVAQASGDVIVVANGTSATPAAIAPQNIPLQTTPAAMSAHGVFSQQYPPMGDYGMHVPGFFSAHMTQQSVPQFMTCIPPRMDPGNPYGMPNTMPMPNTMGQRMMEPNMMLYGLQQHLIHQHPATYGFLNQYTHPQQHVFPGSPYSPVGSVVNHHHGNSGNNSQNNEDDQQSN